MPIPCLSKGLCTYKEETYSGLEGYNIITFQGLLAGYKLTAALVDERGGIWGVTEEILGI